MSEFMSFQPLVTVYMPTYNRVELLQRAVDSVLTQDYKNIELIVVDDKSTDSTHEYLAKMAKEDSRFKYFINEKNSGACVSRNKAIFAATGEFITGLDDDDYFLANHISCLVENAHFLDYHSIALYSNSYRKLKNNHTSKLVKIKKLKNCTHSQLLASNWIGNQIFTKTRYLREIGGFEESLPAWQDLECWYRLLSYYNSKAYLVPQYTYINDISHIHERITSSKKSSKLKAFSIIYNKHNLSYRQRMVLTLQLNPYVKKPVSLVSIIGGFVQAPNLLNVRKTILLLGSKLKRTIIS